MNKKTKKMFVKMVACIIVYLIFVHSHLYQDHQDMLCIPVRKKNDNPIQGDDFPIETMIPGLGRCEIPEIPQAAPLTARPFRAPFLRRTCAWSAGHEALRLRLPVG